MMVRKFLFWISLSVKDTFLWSQDYWHGWFDVVCLIKGRKEKIISCFVRQNRLCNSDDDLDFLQLSGDSEMDKGNLVPSR